MQTTKIPRYIDSTPQLFFWEIDEFMILAASMGVGILFGGMNTVYGLICGFALVNMFKRYKAGSLPGQLNHLFHWHNIMNMNAYFPRSGVRRIFK